MIKLSDLKPLEKNPRTITVGEEKKLRESLQENDFMLEAREIIIDENNVILGGNQRYKQLLALGYEVIPDEWVKKFTDWTEEQKKAFIILDNRLNGTFDIEIVLTDFKETFEKIDKLFIDNTNYQFEQETESGEPIKEEKKKTDWYITINCDSEEHAKQLLEEIKQTGEVAHIHN